MKKRTRTSPDAPASGNGSVSTDSWFPFVLGALVASTIFLSGEQNERSGAVHLPAILWLSAAALWTLGPVLSRKPLPKLRFSKLDAFVYAFFALVAASIFWNLLPGKGGAPRPGFNMLSVWILLPTAWFLFRQILHDRRLVFSMLALVAAVVAAEALTGLYQRFVDIPDMIRRFEADPEKTLRMADPTLEPGTPNWDRMAIRLKSATPMGTYPMSNTLGGLLACGGILLLGMGLFHKRISTVPRGVAWAVLLVVVFACLAFTKCRSAYVAAVIGVGLHVLGSLLRRLEKPSGKCLAFLLVGLAATLLVTAALVPASGKTVISGAKKSLGFRFEYWKASAGMIRDYPAFGCGSGNFKQTYTKYKLPESSEEISDPHNFAVEIVAVSGIPALLLFLVSALILTCRSVGCESLPNDETNSSEKPARLFWGGLFGCWLAFSASFHSEAAMNVAAPLAATLAFPSIAWLYRISSAENSVPERIPRGPVFLALIVLLVHLLAAGGVSVSSTAILLWLFPAILATSSDGRRVGTSGSDSLRTRILLATIFVLMIFTVDRFGLRPVSKAFSLSLQAETEDDTLRKINLLRRAADADPRSATLRERLALETFRRWTFAPAADPWKNESLAAQRNAVRLMPRSATLRFACAERTNLMFQKTGNPELRDLAEELYREAIERYPNNARFRAAYALFLQAEGRRAEALRLRDEALSLDDLMPHADQKLPADVRKTLVRLGD